MEDEMIESIPNLWPEEFKIDVQTPYTILRVQANLLSKVTRGILEGTVETEMSKEMVQHRLVVVAPAYNGYRHTLVVALHNPDLPYPAEVRAKVLGKQVKRESVISNPFLDTYHTVYPSASSDDQMQDLVKRALQSDESKAAILSLIAKSNEARLSPSQTPQNGTGAPGSTSKETSSEANPTPEE
jgi:hypothetical protein